MQKDGNIIASNDFIRVLEHTNGVFIKDNLLTLDNKQTLDALIFKIQKLYLQSIIDRK